MRKRSEFRSCWGGKVIDMLDTMNLPSRPSDNIYELHVDIFNCQTLNRCLHQPSEHRCTQCQRACGKGSSAVSGVLGWRS